MPIELPRTQIAPLMELGAKLLDSRKPGTDLRTLARDLYGGFHDACLRAGLDRVLAEVAAANPPLDASTLVGDRATLADHEALFAALVEQLDKLGLDGGGPRNTRPRQLADSVVAALGLTVVDEPERTLALPDEVRAAFVAAIASVVEPALANLRATIIAEGRARCEERYHASYDKLVKELDERGQQLVKQPKLPLDAVQAIQRVLFDTRATVIDRVGSEAIDRAKDVLARTDAVAAERIDAPVSFVLTPRDVAIARAADPRVPKTVPHVVKALADGITELAHLTWRAAEKPVRPYAASQRFAVGDVVEHPKFGRGTVVASLTQRIEVEFADGKYTLVHAGATK